MRNYNTEAEMTYIPNVSWKRNTICQMYNEHCDYTDIQGYFTEQLELNPKLLAWLFDDNTLFGKSPHCLDGERYEAFQDFYNSLDIWD